MLEEMLETERLRGECRKLMRDWWDDMMMSGTIELEIAAVEERGFPLRRWREPNTVK